MKTSNVLASLLFGSLAAAAPLNKRDYVTKTELVVETVVVYTTVWDGEAPKTVAAERTGAFYEKPSQPASSIKAGPTSQYTPPQPSSVYVPPVSAPAPSSVYTPPAAPSAPKPVSSAVVQAPSSAAAPAPAQSSAPAAAQPSSSGGGNGQKYHGDLTIYDNTGAAGACGKAVHDTDKIVALAQSTWGKSTYDVMTGEATNPWCGKKITISYKGKTVDATIMDMCPGCSGADIDLSLSLWKELTGLDEKTRLQGDWWVS
ncbi:hypothetical protein K469DRAFT_709216 [Zopfia rhizophila CBS 207.26]|uniref:RlpA-like protein double-psi beta-barrel domain-containing protein n=1 Tax=Zopfia rhizophila CBS 207.26 TaxID=1314779 RepID=A0A6A6E174_9PEZI|nr:hypothetical protein K469DRAFT_709216 [Zopfia rhizophila CBS 207.26]